ncbi:MAG: hypothetical protein GX442_01635 [Candidatus Riflebacteria bacterium]|nr:hypothetical protein [Candidatus Riflebacteria bacterium]
MIGRPVALLLGLLTLALALLPLPVGAAGKKKPAETVAPPPPAPVEPKVFFKTTYRAIVEAGDYEELKTRVPDGMTVMKSEDGHSGYLLKTVPVTSEEQLIGLMGATSTAGLTDGQRGLVAAYRFSCSPAVGQYTPYFPYPAATFTIELNDTTGFDDETRFPAVQNDFWPRNGRMVWTLDGKPSAAEFTICMSPVATRGFGVDTAPQMYSIMIHELAHSLDLTAAEEGAYGKDGTHYFNERIGERAAFQEGFADYAQFALEPSLVDRYRRDLDRVKLEGENGYTTLSATDTALPAADLLRVEGVVALTLFRMSRTIPGGGRKILAAFKASNATDNTFPRFLKTYAGQNPDAVASVAAALDAETHGRLTAGELRSLLGSSPALEEYLAGRAAPADEAPGAVFAPVALPPTPVAPPQDGVTQSTTAIRQPVRLAPEDTSPFADGE